MKYPVKLIVKGMGRSERTFNAIATYAPKNTIFTPNAATIIAVNRSGPRRYVRSAATHDVVATASGPSIPASNSTASFAPDIVATADAASHDPRLAAVIHATAFIGGRRSSRAPTSRR